MLVLIVYLNITNELIRNTTSTKYLRLCTLIKWKVKCANTLDYIEPLLDTFLKHRVYHIVNNKVPLPRHLPSQSNKDVMEAKEGRDSRLDRREDSLIFLLRK
jgi:hypothetical protein